MNERAAQLNATCEEVITKIGEKYIHCGKPAVALVYHSREGRSYSMCLGCADHNIDNRGGVLVFTTNDELRERYKPLPGTRRPQ
jgi:hypothetical protein